MAGLQKYDGVVLSNVSSLKLTRPQMAQIRDYVRDYGGGLIMVGGEESFGLGGYYRTPIEEALPVTMEVKQKVEIPSLAVVLSIDRSGSMAMSHRTRRSPSSTSPRRPPTSWSTCSTSATRSACMSWDTEFIWDASVRPAKDKAAIHHAIATIKAGGGTDGYPALKESYAVLFERPALLKHVIFLSDGQMTRGDFQGLLRRMAKDKITVSTVAIGKDADVQLMVDIAKWGKGRFYYTEDSQTIPRIFTLETQLASKASLVEQPFKPQLTAPGHEAIQEIDWKNVPPLGRLRGHHAEVDGRAGADEPPGRSRARHLAVRPGPLGRVHLGRQGQVGRALAPVARLQQVLGPAHPLDAAQRHPERHRRDRGATRWTSGEVVVDAVDAKGEFINFLDSQVGVVAPNRERTVIDLEQVGPGRYRGRFPAAAGGRLPGRHGPAPERARGRLAAGRVWWYRMLRSCAISASTRPLLRELAELTGGGAARRSRRTRS